MDIVNLGVRTLTQNKLLLDTSPCSKISFIFYSRIYSCTNNSGVENQIQNTESGEPLTDP